MHVSTTRQAAPDGGSIHLTLTFADDALRVTSTPFGMVLALDSCSPSGAPGAPALPRCLLRVAVPQETHVTGISVTAVRTLPVTSAPMLVAPVQHPQPGIMDNGVPPVGQGPQPSTRRLPQQPVIPLYLAPPVVAPDLALYEQELRSPRPVAQLYTAEYLGLVHIASIEINPVRLTPAGLLEFYPEITVTLAYSSDQIAGGELSGWTPPSRDALTTHAQAKRLYMLATLTVVNPQDVWDASHIFSGPSSHIHTPVDYLIITDNQAWNEQTIAPAGTVGDLVSAFQPLIDWKASRGLEATLVTISDIVSGRYGDFRRGARDLQELLRRFLQWAVKHWGIAWVLLGGSVDIIPTRIVASPLGPHIGIQAKDPPPKNSSYWTGSLLKMRVEGEDGSLGLWWPGLTKERPLVRPDTGARILYDDSGKASATSPGWYFATDETYTTLSTAPTKFVVVQGPESLVKGEWQWLYFFGNTIATDLYYASLIGPQYGLPGHHDWDLDENGIYGQHTDATDDSADLDGVSFHPDVSVGRAPVANATDATTFVTKVIDYERFRGPDGRVLDRDWPGRVELLSTNWGGRFGCWREAKNPPTEGHYLHEDSHPYALIHLQYVPTDLSWNLFIGVTEADLRMAPYREDASASVRGWYYARSATDLTPSAISGSLPGAGKAFSFPVPTSWVVVYSGLPEELTPWAYVFDNVEEDGSEADQERLREQLAADLPGIRVNRLYDDDNDLTPAEAAAAPVAHITASRVEAALNAGPHFVSLSGHGSWDGACDLSRDMADRLTNGPYPFIAYADSCLTSQFDHGNPFNVGADPCSAHLLNNPHGGAVAYIGNSRYSFIGPGAIYQRLVFHQMTTTNHLGLVFDTLRTILHAVPGSEVLSRWAMFALNLMGDPEMPLWLPNPPYIHVRPPEQVVPFYVSKAVPLVVNVTQQGGHPGGLVEAVEGVIVSMRQGALTRVASTDARGIAMLSLEGVVPGPLEITASQFGAVPARQVIQIAGQRSAGGMRRVLLVLTGLLLLLLLVAFVVFAVFVRHG
jgi:hypothetical protein